MLAIELTETHPNREQAKASLLEMRGRDGFLGGRVLSYKDPVRHRVESFFQAEDGTALDNPMPSGMRAVVVPHLLRWQLGFPDTHDVTEFIVIDEGFQQAYSEAPARPHDSFFYEDDTAVRKLKVTTGRVTLALAIVAVTLWAMAVT
jgi:hypothetical protein